MKTKEIEKLPKESRYQCVYCPDRAVYRIDREYLCRKCFNEAYMPVWSDSSCVVCGAYAPEGSMICRACEKRHEGEEQ